MEVSPNGIYNRQQLAEILGCSERTVDYYYTLGLPRKRIRSRNYTTGRQVLSFIENQESSPREANPKVSKFRNEYL